MIVVSSDAHVGPLSSQLREYCPKQYLEAFDAEAQPDADGPFGGETDPLHAGDAAKDFLDEFTPGVMHNLQSAGHHDVYARLADMDRDGVACEVVFHGSQNGESIPFVDPVAGMTGLESGTRSHELARAGRQIYNRWLADFCSVEPERHVGLAQISFSNLDEAIEDMRWAADHGLRGVNFPAPRSDMPPFEDQVWEPFFAECAERNMVLNTHIGGAEMLDRPAYKGPATMAIRSVENPWLGRRGMWHLTFTGAFERHPNLKFVLTELPGVWWEESVREMDSAYFTQAQGATLRKHLSKPPSEYVATNIWVGASFMSRTEALQASAGGYASRFMWGSDYPHAEGTWYYAANDDEPVVTRLSLANTFHDLPERDLRQMCGDNAVAVYALDRAALQRVAERIGPRLHELSAAPDLSLVPQQYSGFGFRQYGSWA